MKKERRLRLSPSMVVACIALSVALGGTSVAAIQALPRNSVGAKQLKRNAVTGPKIKANAVAGPKVANNSLTGADVRESSLGQVPSALNAQNATNATNATNAVNASNASNATNATTASNALALGGVAASGYVQRHFAKVQYNAALPVILAGSSGVTAEPEGGVGFPRIRFPVSVDNCAVIATPSSAAGSFIARHSTGTSGTLVQLAIQDDAGAAVRANFSIVAIC